MFSFLKGAPSTKDAVSVITSSPSAPTPLKYYGTLVLGSQQYPIRDTVGTIRYSGYTLSYSVLSSNKGDNGAGLRLVWTPPTEANPDALTSISSLNASLKHIRAALDEANNQLISLSSSATTDESTIAAIGRLFIHRSSLENELKTLLQKQSITIECPEAQIFNLPCGFYCSITFDSIHQYNHEKNGKTEIIDEKKSQIKGILALWAPFLSCSLIKDSGFSEIVQVPILYKKSLNIFELERQSIPFINDPEKSKFFAEPNKGLQSVLNYIANNATNKNKKQIKSFNLAGSWSSSSFVVGNLFGTCGNKPFFVVIKHSNGTIFGCFVPQSLADGCYTPLDPDTLLFSISADGELRAILKAFENEKDHNNNNTTTSDGRQIFLGSGCGLHLGIPTGYDNDLSICINHSGSGVASIHGSCNPHVFKYMVDGGASLSEISSNGFLAAINEPNFNAELIETFTVHFDTD